MSPMSQSHIGASLRRHALFTGRSMSEADDRLDVVVFL